MDGIFPIVGGALLTTQGFFFGSWMVSIIESCPRVERRQLRRESQGMRVATRSRCSFRTSTRANGGSSTSTRPRPTRSGAITWGDYYLDIQDARDLYYRTDGIRARLGRRHTGLQRRLECGAALDQGEDPVHRQPTGSVHSARATSKPLVKAIPNARAVWIDSVAGHLICCNADPKATRVMGEAIREFLSELSAPKISSDCQALEQEELTT